jgi:hypothetical protein
MINILKIFIKKYSLKRKILNIVHDIKAEVKAHCNQRFWINWYGAYEIDPKNLAIWVCVKTDKTKLKLTSNTELKTRINYLFIKYDYPIHERSGVQVDFESQETVDRESHGNWYQHFK